MLLSLSEERESIWEQRKKDGRIEEGREEEEEGQEEEDGEVGVSPVGF